MKREARAFRDATKMAARSLVTCGFELETQSTHGYTWNELRGDGGCECGDPDCSGRGDGPSPAEFISDNYRVPARVEVGSDSTVEGFEFRTRGGLTYEQFREASKGVFAMTHNVDTECSFHVHVSVRGVQHAYGERLQRAMVEFLADNLHRVPASVRERWANVRDNEYISTLVGNDDKYNFVNKHGHFNTWEFRCFGNVKTHGDAMRCLDLALAALQYGYKVITGRAALTSDQYDADQDTWEDAVYRALQSGRRLSAVLSDNAELAA